MPFFHILVCMHIYCDVDTRVLTSCSSCCSPTISSPDSLFHCLLIRKRVHDALTDAPVGPCVCDESASLGCASFADPKTWQAAVGVPQAEAIVARLMSFLAAKCSLFPCLACMLQTACPPMLQQQQQQQQQQQAMSIPETLASNLVVRFLSLKKFPEVAAAQAGLPKLLCVPLLWHRCPRVLLNVRSCTWYTVCSSSLCYSTALSALCGPVCVLRSCP